MKGKNITEFGLSMTSGSFTFVIASVIKAFLMLLIVIVLGRLLKSSGFGLYTIVIAIYSILETGSYFGFGAAIRQKLPEAKGKEAKLSIVSNGFAISVTIGIVLMLALIALSGYIAINLYGNASLILPIDISAVAILFSLTYNIANSALLGLLKSKEAGLMYILFAATYLLTSTILVLAQYGVAGAVSGLLVGYFVSSIVSVMYLRKFIGFKLMKLAREVISDLVKFSVPVFVSTASTTIATNLGIAFLALFVSSAIVGNYGVAYKVGSFADTILIAATTVLLPIFSQVFSSKHLSKSLGIAYNGSIYYTLLLLLPLVAYMISISVPFMGLLFGYDFGAAPFYFAVVGAGLTIGIFGRYASTLILGYGDAKRFMTYQVIVTILQVVLTLILVPYFKVTGLLLALYVLGNILLDVVYVYGMRKQFKFKLEIGKNLRLLLASVIIGLILGGISILLNQSILAIVVNAIVILVLYPPLVVMLEGVEARNLEFMEKVSSKLMLVKPFAKYLLKYMQLFVRS